MYSSCFPQFIVNLPCFVDFARMLSFLIPRRFSNMFRPNLLLPTFRRTEIAIKPFADYHYYSDMVNVRSVFSLFSVLLLIFFKSNHVWLSSQHEKDTDEKHADDESDYDDVCSQSPSMHPIYLRDTIHSSFLLSSEPY